MVKYVDLDWAAIGRTMRASVEDISAGTPELGRPTLHEAYEVFLDSPSLFCDEIGEDQEIILPATPNAMFIAGFYDAI